MENDEKTITLGQLKAFAELMTYMPKLHNVSSEWVRGIEEFVEKVTGFVSEVEE